MLYPMIPSLAKAYQENLLREAERGRPVQVPASAGSRLQGRVFLRLGDWLISLGTKLRERSEPTMPYGHGAYPSAVGKARA